MNTSKTGIMIGIGRLTWPRGERVSDRYGYVYLIKDGDSTTPETIPADMAVREQDKGQSVILKALVTETRQSTHIGDLFRSVYPKTPKVGQTITLGIGRLSVEIHPDCGMLVGLEPEDGRQSDWLDIKALYRAHEQTVQLYYEPVL